MLKLILVIVVLLSCSVLSAQARKTTTKTDSLKTELFIANFRLERVRYYIKICKRHPKQTKFLVSWIDRAIR